MRIRLEVEVDVDVDAWSLSYGQTRAEAVEDALEYLPTQVRGELDECGRRRGTFGVPESVRVVGVEFTPAEQRDLDEERRRPTR